MFTSAIALLLLGRQDPMPSGVFREAKDGWIVVHLSGTPHEIGVEYGTLLAPEIEDAHEALKAELRFEGSRDWDYYRDTAKRVFWDKVPDEYRAEMQGQTEALQKKGSKLDLWDVLAFNAYIELSGYYIPWESSQRTGKVLSGARESCSAFVATGATTRDGKIVMGHSLWWDYTIGQRFRTILDIRPEKGQRLMMDTLSGFIHSGSDFGINSAGMMLCETTISGFHGFDPNGVPEFVRMRKALQYSKSLDDMVRIFKDGNNGGYANTWLMGDAKTGEIGKLELGLKNVTFDRTKDGYYVGANFPENPKLIAEEVSGYSADPKYNSCLRRKARWNSLLTQNKGAVDAPKAEAFLADTFDEVGQRKGASSSTLCGRSDLVGGGPFGAVNAKVVTSDLAGKMSFWARMGFADGSTFEAASYVARNDWLAPVKPFLKDIPERPWVLVDGGPPSEPRERIGGRTGPGIGARGLSQVR